MRRLIAVGFLLVSLPLFAAPRVMNYQAKLTDSNGVPITMSVLLNFTFWSAESGGSQLGNGYNFLEFVTPDSRGVCSTSIGMDFDGHIPASVFSSNFVFLNVNVDGTDIVPRERIASVGFALDAFPLYGEAYVIPDVTSDASLNGINLLEAYQHAGSLFPQGFPRSATNRAAVILPPGRYDLGNSQLILDHTFVDIVGLSTKRSDQFIFGTTSGINTGVINQSANDVGFENLLVQNLASTGTLASNSNDPAAYFPATGLTSTTIHNCEFRDDGANHSWSMRVGIAYSGKYDNCVGGNGAFGGETGGKADGTFNDCIGGFAAFAGFGTASGTFKDCSGGQFAFGGIGTASGVFTHCSAGDQSFGCIVNASGTFNDCSGGNDAFGGIGMAPGTFTNCTGGADAFGGIGISSGNFTNCKGGSLAFGGEGTASGIYNNCAGGDRTFGSFGVASGTFTNCTGTTTSFGSFGTASGTFTDCTGTTDSFAANGTANGIFKDCSGGIGSFGTRGTASGRFTDCVGGDRAFGGPNSSHTTTGTATGTFINCAGGNESFGGKGGKASGTFTNCTGGDDSFGGGGTANGIYTNCTGTDFAFGGDAGGKSAGAKLYGCRMNGSEWGVPFSGRMENCFWGVGFICTSSARIYGSIIAGALDLGNTAAGVTGSRAQVISNDASNVFGATNAAAFNIEDADVN